MAESLKFVVSCAALASRTGKDRPLSSRWGMRPWLTCGGLGGGGERLVALLIQGDRHNHLRGA